MFKKSIIIFLSDVIAIINFIIKRIFTLLSRKRDKKTLRVLVYHSVSGDAFYKDLSENNVRLDMFRQQMLILKKTPKRIVSLTEGLNGLRKNNLSHDSIAITFDDGTEDIYNEASKVLEDFHIPAIFFVVYKYAEEGKRGFMNWDMVFSLKERGFEIGSHSYSHKRLGALNDEDLEKETGYAKRKFEEKGIPVEYFAYPYGFYGDFSEKTEKAIRKTGFKTCFTSIMGDNKPGDDLFELKRTRISWRDNPFRFKMKINGFYDWVDKLKYKIYL